MKKSISTFKKNSFLLIISVLVNSPILSYATCDTNVYNSTNQSFNLLVNSTYGDIYFTNINPSQCPDSKIKHGKPVNGPCTLKPNDLIVLSYTTTGDNIYGDMFITDSSNQTIRIPYSNNKHGDCPKLLDTDPQNTNFNFNLNYPNDGFFVIESTFGDK